MSERREAHCFASLNNRYTSPRLLPFASTCFAGHPAGPAGQLIVCHLSNGGRDTGPGSLTPSRGLIVVIHDQAKRDS